MLHATLCKPVLFGEELCMLSSCVQDLLPRPIWLLSFVKCDQPLQEKLPEHQGFRLETTIKQHPCCSGVSKPLSIIILASCKVCCRERERVIGAQASSKDNCICSCSKEHPEPDRASKTQVQWHLGAELPKPCYLGA